MWGVKACPPPLAHCTRAPHKHWGALFATPNFSTGAPPLCGGINTEREKPERVDGDAMDQVQSSAHGLLKTAHKASHPHHTLYRDRDVVVLDDA